MTQAGNDATVVDAVDSLYVTKAKPTKEEKSLIKKQKLKAKKALAGEVQDDDSEPELTAAPKAELKKCKKRAADKRKGGEEATTDDELEAAGFFAQ